MKFGRNIPETKGRLHERHSTVESTHLADLSTLNANKKAVL